MSKDLKILVVGDDINTDDIIAAKRCTTADPEHLRTYALEHIIGEGNLIGYDIIKAGRNFGCGSSREHAPIAIKAAGIKKVKAHSFAEIFYRNSINIGLNLEIITETKDDPIVAEITKVGGLIPFNQKRKTGEITIPKSSTLPRLMTMAEKLLAIASGNEYVKHGETVFAKVDLAMSHDAVAGPVARVFYKNFGIEAKLWDPQKVVLVADHFIQLSDVREDAKATVLYEEMIDFANSQGCHLLDIISPGEAAGICHVLLPEKGFIQSGMIIAGTDSHTCTYGAFGCFSTGVGTTDMANIFAMGDMWVRVPETLLFILDGTLPKHICAKDIILFILGQIGCDGATGKVMEFWGSIIDQLSMDERMTLSNMAIEGGAMCGLIAPDQITREYLEQKSNASHPKLKNVMEVTSDVGAEYAQVYRFDLSNLESQIAQPPKPDQVVNISELGEVLITRAFIGSCTGGKLFDLAQAAEVLKGRQVAPNVDLFIVPASQDVRQQAEQLGYMQIFKSAGGQVLKSGCGACINSGFGTLKKDETGIYATNRNFKGRSGDPTAKNYLASPRVVAISSVRGKISDRFSDHESK